MNSPGFDPQVSEPATKWIERQILPGFYLRIEKIKLGSEQLPL
jgi:hypothetical protein